LPTGISVQHVPVLNLSEHLEKGQDQKSFKKSEPALELLRKILVVMADICRVRGTINFYSFVVIKATVGIFNTLAGTVIGSVADPDDFGPDPIS
jgi:hypothetical protein